MSVEQQPVLPPVLPPVEQPHEDDAAALLATRRGSSSFFGLFEPFDPTRPREWNDYLTEFNVYFSANRLNLEPPELQRDIFLHLIGKSTFRLLRSLIAPESYNTRTIAQLKETLTRYFNPRPSLIVNSFKFMKRDQGSNERVGEYVTALRSLANKCEFGQLLNRLIRDKFIAGLHNPVMQEKLLEAGDIELETAIDRATAYEVAVANTAVVRQSTVSTPIFQADNNTKPGKKQFSRFRSKSRSRKPPTNQSQPTTSNKGQPSGQSKCAGCNGPHTRNSCPYLDHKCTSCGKTGHVETACRSKPNNVNAVSSSTYLVNHTTAIPFTKPKLLQIRVNNVDITFEIDTGASVTIISSFAYDRLNRLSPTPLSPYRGNIRGVGGHRLPTLGATDVWAQYKSIKCRLPLIVAKDVTPNLLGRNWFDKLGFFVGGINSISLDSSLQTIVSKFEKVFSDKLGTYRGPPVDLLLNPSIKPIYCRARRVPLGLLPKVEKAIDDLVEQNVFSPIENVSWGTPLVPVVKPDGSIRICADYKITLNKALNDHPYPIPVVSHLLTNLSGGKVFVKLDLAQAYLQLPVTDESAIAQTVITHRGAFRVNRLQFGIKQAPGIFQSTMEKLLIGIPGLAIYFDDIIIAGKDIRELGNRLSMVLKKFSNVGLHLNKSKCKFGLTEVKCLGFIVSGKGIQPDPDLYQAVQDAPSPNSQRELQAFLGLLNFFHAFLPQKATVANPLHKLLEHSSTWNWKPHHEKAFKACKQLLSKDLILAHFDPKQPIVLVCDASPVGVGAVLCHKNSERTEVPIAFYSRSLTACEKNYAQIDREALAIVAGVKKFHHFLYGNKFEIITDHKPLLGLFDVTKATPAIMSPRMLRWNNLLSSYDYRIKHRPGLQISHADGLSRLPLPVVDSDTSVLHDVLLIESSDLPVTANEIAKATRTDSILSRVYNYVVRGWPHSNAIPLDIKPYYPHRSVLSCYRNCLLFGTRVVIPTSLRKRFTESLHYGHPGMTRMKALARMYAWWPDITSDVENYVKTCVSCQQYQTSPNSSAIVQWPKPTSPWHRVHADFAGPFHGRRFFLLVDSYSHWLEVKEVPSTSVNSAVRSLRSIFATHGLPKVLVTDNDPTVFGTPTFKEFCTKNAIELRNTAPYHPSSNGPIERMVQSTKTALKKLLAESNRNDDMVWEHALSVFLFAQHITPIADERLSPSEMLMRRRLRTTLDAVIPDHTTVAGQVTSPSKNTNSTNRSFELGDPVFLESFQKGPRWVPAVIVNRRGLVNYDAVTDTGRSFHRHVDQLRPRTLTSSPATMAPSSYPSDISFDPDRQSDRHDENLESSTSFRSAIGDPETSTPSNQGESQFPPVPRTVTIRRRVRFSDPETSDSDTSGSDIIDDEGHDPTYLPDSSCSN